MALQEQNVKPESIETLNEDVKITFDPPLFIQRYRSVYDALTYESTKPHVIKKVADFGCAGLKFFWYLKSMPNIEHIVEVDVDEELMKRKCYVGKPLISDHLNKRETPLVVDVMVGNVAVPDSRLFNVDALVGIELIEHLVAQDLSHLPLSVFGTMKPKLVIFTTPNYEFNALFKTTGFRHWDHKFEWTRKQFQKWCSDIVSEYPDYEVTYEGIGEGPPGSEHLGCCSQMATFKRKSGEQSEHVDEACNNSNNNNIDNAAYNTIAHYVYPWEVDTRSEQDKFYQELNYRVNSLTYHEDYYDNYGDKSVIPLRLLLMYVEKWCSDEQVLSEHLMKIGNGNLVQMENGSLGWQVERILPNSKFFESDSSEENSDQEEDEQQFPEEVLVPSDAGNSEMLALSN